MMHETSMISYLSCQTCKHFNNKHTECTWRKENYSKNICKQFDHWETKNQQEFNLIVAKLLWDIEWQLKDELWKEEED